MVLALYSKITFLGGNPLTLNSPRKSHEAKIYDDKLTNLMKFLC